MHRTLIQLDEPLYEDLKRRAFEAGISLSGLIRGILSKAIGRGRITKKKRKIDSFKFIGSGRSKEKLTSVDHDKYLAEDFLK